MIGNIMGIFKIFIIMVGMVSISGHLHAGSESVEFSADAVINIPQQPVRQTRLYVSEKAIRSESIIDGQSMVEIVYPQQGRAILINNPLRSYKEKAFISQSEKEDSGSPCDQIANAVCEMLGTEEINGHKTEKWQVISESRSKKLRTLHWIDVKTRLAVREFFPDGSFSELKLLGKEKVNGRDTEKWQRTLSRPDGTKAVSYQWYDAELKIAIKEEIPGGYVRELTNIKIGRQPEDLFSAPDDYKKIEAQSDNYREYK